MRPFLLQGDKFADTVLRVAFLGKFTCTDLIINQIGKRYPARFFLKLLGIYQYNYGKNVKKINTYKDLKSLQETQNFDLEL